MMLEIENFLVRENCRRIEKRGESENSFYVIFKERKTAAQIREKMELEKMKSYRFGFFEYGNGFLYLMKPKGSNTKIPANRIFEAFKDEEIQLFHENGIEKNCLACLFSYFLGENINFITRDF